MSTKSEEIAGRDRWKSRTTFVLGALGASVGLGNLWRFPFLVFKHGGGTFLIPYLIGLVLIGVPLLLMELTLGRKFQGGDPVCFSSMHPRMVGVGWMSLFGTVLLATYYPVLIAWIVIFFFNSFKSPLPWSLDETNLSSQVIGLERLKSATSFFNNDVLDVSDSIVEQDSANGWLILSLVFVWVCIYLSIFKGVSEVSDVVKISVPVPIITLIVLLGNSIGRDGAKEGVDSYIGNWDLDVLDDPAIWQDAVGQVFFSIGVCFGIMTAYSSYMESSKGLITDAIVIGILDSVVSLFAGFVVFTAIGVLAHEIDVDINDDDFANIIGGAKLVFIAYPAALDSLDKAPQFFSVVFFVTLFFLAIDSAFSLVEAIVTGIHDTNFGQKKTREGITLGVVIALFIFGLFFAVDNGAYMLDIVDYYLNNFIMIGIGALECIASMWIFGIEESFTEIGHKPVLALSFIYGLGAILAPVVIIGVDKDSGNNIWGGFLTWILFSVMAFIVAFLLITSKELSTKDKFTKLLFSGGASKLVIMMGADEYDHQNNVPTFHWGVLYAWALFCKYLIPVFLFMLVITGADANRKEPSLSLDVYPNSFQNIGVFVVVVAWGLFFLFIFVRVDAYSNKNKEFEETRALLDEERKAMDKKGTNNKSNESDDTTDSTEKQTADAHPESNNLQKV